MGPLLPPFARIEKLDNSTEFKNLDVKIFGGTTLSTRLHLFIFQKHGKNFLFSSFCTSNKGASVITK